MGETSLKGLFAWVGYVRATIALFSFGVTHYWAFLVGLPGNITFLSDATFFVQFQALMVGNAVIASAVSAFLFITLSMMFDVLDDFTDHSMLQKISIFILSFKARLLITFLIFLGFYTGLAIPKYLFPFLFDFWDHLLTFIISCSLLLIIVIGNRVRRRRTANSIERDKAQPTSELQLDAKRARTNLLLASLVVMIAVIVGIGRAGLITNISSSRVVVSDAVYQVRLIGNSGSGVIGIEESCGCLVLIPLGKIELIEPPRIRSLDRYL
jgi:hypothetical protein